jgi:hypothetical protein
MLVSIQRAIGFGNGVGQDWMARARLHHNKKFQPASVP